MSRLGWWLRLTWVFVILLVGTVAMHAPAWAQADGWSYVFTPQLWTSHIAKNGFAATNELAGLSSVNNSFRAHPEPADPLDPQWGFQFAAQKGRWTVAMGFQYVDFETRNDINLARGPQCVLVGGVCQAGTLINEGETVATELVQTTRADLDLAASYFFPDVVKDRLDLSLGGGIKLIYAHASREFVDLNGAASTVVGNRARNQERPSGLYVICKHDNCADAMTASAAAPFPKSKDHANTDSLLAAVTIPMAGTYHLANRWLASLSVSPLVGIEYRDDRDVVYRFKGPTFATRAVTVDRQDGTALALGGTSDLVFRHLLTDTVSVYGGARLQYINGLSEFLAYGPLFGMSVRFGGK